MHPIGDVGETDRNLVVRGKHRRTPFELPRAHTEAHRTQVEDDRNPERSQSFATWLRAAPSVFRERPG